MQASLAKPLQAGVKQAFEKQLLPAVEKATQEMFRQTNSALVAGLAEYTRSAASATSPTIKSLQAVLTQVGV